MILRTGARRQPENSILAVTVVVVLLGAGLDPASAYQRPGHTERVSIPVGVGPGVSRSAIANTPSLSKDGRYVAFDSGKGNLVPGDVNPTADVFVRDRTRGTTELVSVSSLGVQGLGKTWGSWKPSLSANGRFVAFRSDAPNLVVGDTNLADDIFVHDRETGDTTRVSVASDGSEGNFTTPGRCLFPDSDEPSLSANGRYVAFASCATNLVPGDDNGYQDVFVHDRKTGNTEAVSVLTGEETPTSTDAGQRCPSISPTGRYVAFTTATVLVSDDTNAMADVYLHDRKEDVTERVSVGSGGTQAQLGSGNALNSGSGSCGTSGVSIISRAGRYVAFGTSAQNLVPNDTNSFAGVSMHDTFVHDRETTRTERVSVTSSGQEPDGRSEIYFSLSRDARYVVFGSWAQNLAEGDTGTANDDLIPIPGLPQLPFSTPLSGQDYDIFLHDRRTGATEFVSVDSKGAEAQSCDHIITALNPAISADRRFVAFASCADDLAGADDDGTWDTFVRDRGVELGVGDLVSAQQASRLHLAGAPGFVRTGSAWIPDADSDGLDSKAGDAADLIGARIVYRPLLNDIFVVLELESMPQTPLLAGVTAGTVYGTSFEIDGDPYEIRAASTGLGPSGETTAASGLFSCPEDRLLCDKVTDLPVGFGTTGERITLSVPLTDLQIEGGSTISGLRAFTALGSLIGGPAKILDAARI